MLASPIQLKSIVIPTNGAHVFLLQRKALTETKNV